MFINKEKRLKYMGFDDTWFVIIGVIILSFITDYLFNNSFAKHELKWAVINWSISLVFSICNWLIMRVNIIYMRKKFPAFKDNPKRIFLLFLTIVITVISVDTLGGIIVGKLFNQTYYFNERYDILLPIIIISTMVMAMYEAIYYYVRLQRSIREEEQAKRVVVLAQLDALRNQAQPHFFFNSLNTLRDIIDQNSKEDAKQFVDKLSDVYRFILDAGNANLIPLRNEVKFARAYIHIQSERFGDNLKLNWKLPETALDSMIVPMSLQLLLENAIKHNVVSRSKPLTITVAIKDDYLVVNNKIQLKSTQLPSTKVGLKNIEKRHALISDKLPKIENDGNEFTVSIPLLQPSDILT
ncbi:Sensor histidine kinase YpdA [Kordia antarctica]|uniref:Sensor histidine kinase YpdA n=1 Tax=Kordia antarctica TaxID=1218801 RepID=A0A7L4ZKL4_9FLAO|nr:histidine kinase [Kordia antarctica]QHI37253.1 Sensor histidine kinase YpdA [Kordia antarctica]